jgi:uroporphyrinogen-III synthase
MGRQSFSDGATSAAVPVLVTRPEPEATTTAETLSARFGDRVRPVVAPLMAVEFLSPALPEGRFDGVIFTSAAGVAAAGRLGVALPRRAWCVGTKTAERAQAAGFDATAAGGDADALIEALVTARADGRLLHLRGEVSRGSVAERLNSAGIETVSVVIYRQVPQPLSPEAKELLRQPGVVILPLFSPRSAELLAKALPGDVRASLRLVCMSDAVANAVVGVEGTVTVAERPDLLAMLAALGRALG